MNDLEWTYLWWRLSGIPPRAGLCHVAELYTDSALWHPSPWTIGFFGSRSQTYMRHFIASMIKRFGCWDQYETMAWLLPIHQNTASKCWRWYCRWLWTRVGEILEDLCISILIYLRLNIQSKDVCILVNIDSSIAYHFDYRSDSHPQSSRTESCFFCWSFWGNRLSGRQKDIREGLEEIYPGVLSRLVNFCETLFPSQSEIDWNKRILRSEYSEDCLWEKNVHLKWR